MVDTLGCITTLEGYTFDLDGTACGSLRPLLFHDEPKEWPEPLPIRQVDQPLLVRDGDPLPWQLAYFSHSIGNAVFCWKGGKKSSETKETEYWAEYKTLEEELYNGE